MKAESTVKPKKIKILGDKVLVRSNILQVEKVDEISGKITLMYEYDELKYNKNEYIEVISEENNQLRSEVDQLVIDSLMG